MELKNIFYFYILKKKLMNNLFDEICVIGLGFVGLTTALSFTNKNFKVIGIDDNEDVINSLKKRKILFNEPFLRSKLIKAIKNKKIRFEKNLDFLENKNYIFFICVGTPVNAKSEYSLKNLHQTIDLIQKKICKKGYIFIKSTVIPGTTKSIINSKIKNNNLKICSNPEFLREGKAWEDFNFADKIVVGCEDEIFKKISKQIYKKFNTKVTFVNSITAEFSKQLSNAFLSNLISFSNNFAILGEKLKYVDIKTAFHSLRLDKRFFGKPALISSYVHPGLGFGGYCLPKDIKALSKFSKKYNQNSFFEKIVKTNDEIFNMHLKKILKITKTKDKIYILGLSFKEGTDDIRFSKSIDLVDRLLKNRYKNLTLCDPLSYNNLINYYKSKKIIIKKKPNYEKNAFYILSTPYKRYINFIKKIPEKQVIDTRYLI